MDNPIYALWRLGNRSVLALPYELPLRMRIQSLQAWEAATPRRRFIRYVVLPCMAMLQKSGLFQKTRLSDLLPGGKSTIKMLPSTAQALLNDGAWLCITWPAMQERKRLYLHVIGTDGCPQFFAKLAFGEPDINRIKNEHHALAELNDIPNRLFSVPPVVSFAAECNSALLVFEYVDEKNRRPLGSCKAETLESCVRTISGKPGLTIWSNIETCDWWLAFIDRDDFTPDNISHLSELGISGVRTSRVHGDFGPGNLRQSTDGSILIMDWENWSKHAPWLTDRLHYWIASNQHSIFQDIKRAAMDLRSFSAQKDFALKDVIFALIFLTARDSLSSTALLHETMTHFEEE
jgi:hypothetical protein